MSSLSTDPLAPRSPGQDTDPDPQPIASRGRLALIAFGIIVLVVAFWLLPTKHWIVDAFYWVKGLRRDEGFVVFVIVYAVLSAIGLPTSPLNIGAGLLFGLAMGFLASMAGVMASCVGCFLIARYLARGWVLRRVERRPKFAAVLNGLQYESWRMILLTRLNPVLPAAVASYCFGVTPVRFRTYLAASLVGNVPLCLVLAYLGSAGQLAFGKHDWTAWDYVIYGVGFAATVALTVWVTRYTKRKLREYETQAKRQGSGTVPT
jgi:uncharacterized membrane protein YdjX (TVP38/TMEM64 family)